jgi:hypothetical protein
MGGDSSMSKADDEMKLPEGKTCKDCARFSWCKAFFSAHDISAWTSCDWWPSRFVDDTPSDTLPAA